MEDLEYTLQDLQEMNVTIVKIVKNFYLSIQLTGHPVGGVCPFGLATPLAVYCDVSLQAFDEVLPAAGAVHSAVRIAPQRMAELVDAQWVDVCQEVLQEA